MQRTLSLVLLSSLWITPATAQITQYVAPDSAGTNGAVGSGFVGALAAGGKHFRGMRAINPTGSPSELVFTVGPLTTWVRHRDGASGALTGTYRDVQMTTFSTAAGPDRGVESGSFGTSSTPDMLEITFSNPVGHWGAHGHDLESLITDPGYLRAYDSTMTLIYEAPIHYPNGEDGDMGVNFIGIVSPTDNISIVTVQVGNSESQASTNPNAENTNHLALLDMYFGTAAAHPNRLSTTFANNNGGFVGGAVYFDLACTWPTGVTIHALDLNLGHTAGLAGSIDVYARIGDFGWAGPLATGTVASTAAPGLPTRVTFAAGLGIGAGCDYQVAIVANGFNHNYTTGTSPVALIYSNAALTLTAGQASNVPFTAPFFSPRVANVRLFYSNGGTCPAGVTKTGEGCVVEATSIYELMTPTTFDLATSGMLFAVDTISDRIAVLHDPAATLQPFSTTLDLNLGDDDEIEVSAFTGMVLPLVVGSNGWVATGTGNSNTSTPNITTMLENPERAFYSWKNLNPAASGGGRVYYEEIPLGPFLRGLVTFDGVYTWNQTTPNTIQFVCDYISLATTPPAPPEYELLQVEIIWGSMANDGTDVLVGYSPSGINLDPGNEDLSSIVSPVQTDPADLRLELKPDGRPVQGSAATPFNVTACNIPSSSWAHIGIIGLNNPSVPLDGLGIPGCTLYATLDVLSPLQLVTGSTVTWSPLTLPALPPSFAGFEFYLQSCIIGTPLNSAFGFGALVSSGLKCTVGTL